MQVHVINFDGDTDRWKLFQRMNAGGIDVVRVLGIDPGTIDRGRLVESGFIAEPCSRSDRAISRWCSHVALWSQAVENDEILTVVEDGVVLAGDFGLEAQRVLRELPAGWDIVMWGWNFDEALWTEIPDGVSVCRMDFNDQQMCRHIDGFRAGGSRPTAVRLRHCFGSPAYTVTPAGARILLDACLPMTDSKIAFSCGGVVVDSQSIDADMNRAFPAMRAYACIPPIAIAEPGSPAVRL
ncbi:MAG: hypothetical protein QG571_1515 [Pseudomonadota bacterium]|jgi:GR25 family glycosyltransferase involved in LPS biosynthesis|nr:hypothetical protein [Pseudomonadota bacterium]